MVANPLKIRNQNEFIFPKFRGEHKKYMKPPASIRPSFKFDTFSYRYEFQRSPDFHPSQCPTMKIWTQSVKCEHTMPKQPKYGMFTYIYHEKKQIVGKYTLHG